MAPSVGPHVGKRRRQHIQRFDDRKSIRLSVTASSKVAHEDVSTPPISGTQSLLWKLLEGAVSVNQNWHIPSEDYTGLLHTGTEVVPWGSAAAREAVKRTCQEVTLRCQQLIGTYASVDISDEDGR